MGRFDDKVALVTGAGSGIGAAIARRFVDDGATTLLADVSGQQDEVAASLGDRAVARFLDVSNEASVDELETWIRSEYGRLDILANNAGVGGVQALTHEYPTETFDKVISINLRGQFLVMKAGLRLMLESGGGSIVNTASIGSFRATPQSVAYLMSKGATAQLTRTTALEYAKSNIRVNAVAPGTTETPILANSKPEILEMLRRQVPQGRLAQPEEIANVAAFLADAEQASHVNGQIWVVDGGRSAA